jgi:formamidopyrimidine-DNA glycosylase
MPELPDVENVRRRLERWLRGARITAARAEDRNIYRATPRSFAQKLVGRRVETVGRKGKWLRLVLDDELLVFAHLGMTGDFHASARDDGATERFERARLEVISGPKKSIVRYIDPRRWGRIVLAREDIPAWTELGPDPLTDGIDVADLRPKLSRRKRRSIKEVLLEQGVLAGVGNILATEALWKAAIDPRAPAASLGDEDIRRLARAIPWAIDRQLASLAKGDVDDPPKAGVARRSRIDVDDPPKAGVARRNPFLIYGRKGEPCPRCRTPLERFVLGGRTTTFCPRCQERRRR